jgi:hypothetical protein
VCLVCQPLRANELCSEPKQYLYRVPAILSWAVRPTGA